MVLVLGSAPDHTEALEDVYDVINASALDSELLGALVQVEDSVAFDAIVVQETAAQFAQALLFSVVDRTDLAVTPYQGRLRSEEV